MSNPLQQFQDALIVHNVVARVKMSMEHSSPEEMKKYLHDHPNADPKDHSVAKSGGKGGPDPKLAESESQKSKSRSQEMKKQHEEMKSLKSKVDNGDSSANKKFDKAYDKIFEGGETAVKSADKLLKQYSDLGKGATGEAKRQQQAAIKLLEFAVKDWNLNKVDHIKAKGSFTHTKLNQADQTSGYAHQLEVAIRSIGGVLKGDYEMKG